MSDTSKREELIEEAAKAIGEVTYTTSNDQVRAARAALAVFEQAHTPSDGEQGSVEGALWDVVERLSLPLTGVEVQALAESVARRTAVQEPSADDEHNVEAWSPTGHIDSPVSCKKCDRYLFIDADGEWQHVARQEPQGEPTDAETRDVLYFALRDAGEGRTTAEDLSRKLTAALRAAAAIGQEEGR